MKTVLSFELQEGDVVILVDQTSRFIRYDFDCIDEYKVLLKECGRDVYYDRPAHCSGRAMEMMAEVIYEKLQEQSNSGGQYSVDYIEFIKEKDSKGKIDNFETNYELQKYKEFLKSNSLSKRIVNGAIVMNCNPFTLGHQYLIEYASQHVDYLYVFVVQEDKSYFKFEDRFYLVKMGTNNIENVKVIPSGKFIISSTTFSEYFDKANLNGTAIDPSLDIEIFGKHIAPVLDISVRFVGEEPIDRVTNQYNISMNQLLPKYGIELVQIPRKEYDGDIISASRVRQYISDGHWEKIRKIVPDITYQFLYENYYGC